ncbi:hypothetical protein CBM2586_B10194 [Cupriavidus phytorum]|uniref:Portal protein n=1 Tax=Cupriavidus taiwanensis TaxID=164546 RepID=A0A976A6Z1_9BURK|nr:hypothetical protein [Cupriavidus taiwanensis]SOY65599.1 hypothetical protein CBM2586_B10194 [Cupriavidus taiwanensis]
MDTSTVSTAAYSDPLAIWLAGRLKDWEQSRQPQEVKLLECYQDVMRIARENDTAGTGASKARKAKSLFIGSTRNKVRSARAKINDALFGNGQMPIDTEPTNEALAPYADALETIIVDQLERGGFKDTIRSGVNMLAMYGTGFLFGPFVKQDQHIETSVDTSSGFPQLMEKVRPFDLPYFEIGNTLDVYPDPDAKDAQDGAGLFWVSHLSPHTVAAWAKDPSYENIADALKCTTTQRDETGSDQAESIRGNISYWAKGGRIKVARYFGKVPKRHLSAQEGEQADPNQLDEYVDAVVIMAGGVVVKKSESPYKKRPTYRAVYEAVECEMWGVGVAENNAPHQKTVNAAFRLFMDGKGMALLGTKSVDRSKFMPTEDFVKYPGKVYQFRPGLSPDERNSAIIEHVEPDITKGWLDVIKVSEDFSDNDTGITKYTQGNDAQNLNKTATGISMIMNASSLPIKEVLQHIDSQWIECAIEALIDWDLKYLDVETVRMLHGEKIAAAWDQIKKFGKTSFMNWKATGAQTFVQKEVLTQKLQNFMGLAMSNPVMAQLVDPRELLSQVWDAMEIGKESPIRQEDGDPKAQATQMQQHIQQLEAQLKALGDEYNKMDADREGEAEQRLIDRYKAETERLKLLLPSFGPETIKVVAEQFGVQVLDSPDIYTSAEPGEPPGQLEQPAEPTEAPPSAGFPASEGMNG